MIFDLESNGLLDQGDTIHCIGIQDGNLKRAYRGEEIPLALDKLANAPVIVGHNIIGFDIPMINKLYPDWKPKGLVRDTLVLTRLFWPHIKDSDFRQGKLPKKLCGAHSLKAWGHRIGEYKDDAPPFDEWSQKLEDYMMQDVAVTAALWEKVEREAIAWGLPLFSDQHDPHRDAIQLEHRVAEIVHRVERHGFGFDRKRALDLVATLTQRKHEIEKELQRVFPPRTVTSTFTPKASNKRYGYTKGVPVQKEKQEVFNPGSRQQVGKRLIEAGWVPVDYTATGQPVVSEDTLKGLNLPGAQLLSEYYTIDKRLGQIANGAQSWFVHEKDGRIHGRIHPGGAHTGRMTHSNPNVAQVPANYAPYGKECRQCWIPDCGQIMVGCDADGLEQRCLAAYMSNWDKGEYRTTLLEGKKEDATDAHSVNAAAIGCSRDDAKVFFYALIYGAGDFKLGQILGKGREAGRKARDRLMRRLPALAKLTRATKRRISNKGFMTGLDGRRLYSRSENAALNTLLQSAGAIIMKRALVILDDKLRHLKFGEDYAIVGLIHDEFCMTAKPEYAEEVGEAAREAIIEAGTFYNFKCPLEAQYQTGNNWSEVH